MSNALNDVIVVSLDVRIWSGRKKLRPEDLTASGQPAQGPGVARIEEDF